MSKVKSNKIQIDLSTPPNRIYYPGDLVHGSVSIDTSLANQETDLLLTLYGVATVRFEKRSGRHTRTINGKEQILNISQEINTIASQSIYPFTIQIPKPTTALPWSLTLSKENKIEYGIKVRQNSTQKCFLLKRFENSGEVKTEFTLKSYVSKETVKETGNKYYLRVNSEKDTAFWNDGTGDVLLCCICSSERIEVGLRLLDSGWYKQGDLVKFQLDFDNSQFSGHIDHIKVRIIQIWSFQDEHGGNHHEQIVEYPWQYKSVSVLPSSLVSLEQTYRLPDKILPTQEELIVLKVSYKLQVHVSGFDGEEKHTRFGRQFPITVTVEKDILIGS